MERELAEFESNSLEMAKQELVEVEPDSVEKAVPVVEVEPDGLEKTVPVAEVDLEEKLVREVTM